MRLFLASLLFFTFCFSHDIQQKTSDLDMLLKSAEDTQQYIIRILNNISNGIEVIDPGVKGVKTINRLLKTRLNGNISLITDFARATIVVECFHEIYACLEELKKYVDIISIDDHYAFPFLEMYRDLNVIFRDPSNGHIGEIQINSKAMTDFKNNQGHHYFDQIRKLRAKEKIELRNLSVDERKLIEELTQLSKKGYNKAFKESTHNVRIGVYGIYVVDDKVLMVKTKSGSRWIYNFPGGGVEDNEGFADTLKRECIEELGCNVSINKMLCANQILYVNPDFDNYTFSIYYVIDLHDKIDTSIHGAQWFLLDSMPIEQMLESDKEIISNLY